VVTVGATCDRERTIRSKNAEACPVVTAVEAVGTAWRVQVVYALSDGELRFNELKRATGARSKTLSDALDALQEHDLVERRTEPAAPIAVYYRLTVRGEQLRERLDEVGDWAIEWMDDVEDPDQRRPRPR
jgi:DNA-binding HxlR family transcriptional regulator